MIAKDTRKAITVRIPENLHRKLKVYVASNGISVQDLVMDYLTEVLDDEGSSQSAKDTDEN